MNLPRITSLEDAAINIVVSVINRALEALGQRQTLREMAHNRSLLASAAKMGLSSLKCPLARTGELLIDRAIRETWKLTRRFLYHIKYMGTSADECAQYYYFEVIFSQPSAIYPIPQVTTSVFFRVQDTYAEPEGFRGVPIMIFRIEGHRQEHDVRKVLLTADRILAVMMMKRKLYQRVEELGFF